MITARFWIDETQSWGSAINLDSYAELPKIEYRFDESFTTANFTCYSKDLQYSLPIEVWTKCKLTLDDEEFIGFVSNYTDSVVEMGDGYNGNRQVNIGLIELVAVTQYMPLSTLSFKNKVIVTTENDIAKTTVITKKAKEVVSRVSNQIYNIHGTDERPFKLLVDNNDWWVNVEMPEFCFTNCTLFEVLKVIGDAIGGFPYLDFATSGTYTLHYRQWNNLNTARHDDDDIQSVSRSGAIENQGYIIDSTVENLLNVAKNGDNAVVFPNTSNFKTQCTEDYTTQITKDNSFFEVDRPIFQLLKVECKILTINDSTQVGYNVYVDLTDLFVNFERWKTLRTMYDVTGIILDTGVEAKNTRAYWSYGSRRIENIQGSLQKLLGAYVSRMQFPTQESREEAKIEAGLIWIAKQSLVMNFRVTYIPMSSGRVMAMQEGAKKPIGQIHNQDNNIISSSSYANNIQGLVERMHGKSSVYTKTTKRGQPLYHIGEWLNDEVIINASCEYSPTTVFTTYEASPNFNRRNPYVYFPHEQRQWEIPNGATARDRQLLYVDEIECGIDNVVGANNGAVDLDTMCDKVIKYTVPNTKANLAYVAWMTKDEINAETNPKQSNNYGLSTITAIPFGKSILLHWETDDNASMGNRVYAKNSLLVLNNYAYLQKYVAYDEEAEYLNVRISNQPPTSFEFDGEITGTKESDGLLAGDPEQYNKYFDNTFPLSNKKQWDDSVSLATFEDLYIQKDISERILFNYMLNFVGIGDTIVYEGATEYNTMCNSNGLESIKLYFSNEFYSSWEKVPKGVSKTATISYDMYQNNAKMHLATNFVGDYKSVAIVGVDTNGNEHLLFAKNGNGNGGNIDLYMSCRKKLWTKI